ncbi:RluA family pseudouridine synthase [Thermoflavimicrobium dichotomicum]|uniref:Pseudouridine synthase n=1 Tax=Thermoflavimicrobium dichotomicum TaxID=46223 RepID=A0A1I3RLK1_9BACL|nr:RluA family pseudouridine synthase [Thermoflavimicrobium dichotomicum]SFJ46127.1 23S rRNA pseudouridine1911/1915/1917 synthase [Thermoflavimicrobium dichotomicum]
MGESQPTFFYQVEEKENGKMLRQVLESRFRFSKRMMRKLKAHQLVTVNGEVIYLTSRVKTGDQIVVRMMEEELPEHIEPQPVDFRIVYEDEDIVVVDKPPGLVVHPTRGHPDHTLANGLFYHWQQQGQTHKMRPVTRLDKDTSGLMVVAKHAYAHAFLAEQMAKKRYQRMYLAVVHGQMEQDTGTVEAPIGLHPEVATARRVDFEDGDPAITHYQVVQRYSNATLVRLQLETGRTHQIRVHLSWLGYPIIGDSLYGTGNDMHLVSRQALHATYLRLYHPRLQEWKEWDSPLPEDIQDCIRKLQAMME